MQYGQLILLIFVMETSVCFAQTNEADLSSVPIAIGIAKADSLFAARQYTQAFDLYHSVFLSKHYSPAMLLKMAFIQEGLGRLGESLYYLNLYYLASSDPMALRKMEELAEKNRLEGYETSQTARVLAWLQEQYLTIATMLVSLNILLLALLIQNRRRRKASPGLILAALTLTLALLFLQVNFSKETRRGIVTQAPTYLMSGPSAGSSVVDIIGEGHQLRIRGQEDVWLKVEWKEKEVFVRDFLVRKVAL